MMTLIEKPGKRLRAHNYHGEHLEGRSAKARAKAQLAGGHFGENFTVVRGWPVRVGRRSTLTRKL